MSNEEDGTSDYTLILTFKADALDAENIAKQTLETASKASGYGVNFSLSKAVDDA